MKSRQCIVTRTDMGEILTSYPAVFHQFGESYEELQDGVGNHPVALVEREDGQIESVSVDCVRFLTPTENPLLDPEVKRLVEVIAEITLWDTLMGCFRGSREKKHIEAMETIDTLRGSAGMLRNILFPCNWDQT